MVATLASDGKVELGDQLIRAGDDIAYELGTERGQVAMAGEQVSIEPRVTNIYRRECWKSSNACRASDKPAPG